MVLKTCCLGFHRRGLAAMLISTRNTIVCRGLLPLAAKETQMFGLLGPGDIIGVAVAVVAVAGVAIVAVRWFRAGAR